MAFYAVSVSKIYKNLFPLSLRIKIRIFSFTTLIGSLQNEINANELLIRIILRKKMQQAYD